MGKSINYLAHISSLKMIPNKEKRKHQLLLKSTDTRQEGSPVVFTTRINKGKGEDLCSWPNLGIEHSTGKHAQTHIHTYIHSLSLSLSHTNTFSLSHTHTDT